MGLALLTGEDTEEVLGTEVGGVTGTGAGRDEVNENLLISGDDTLVASVGLLAVFLFDSESAISSGAAEMLFMSASYTIYISYNIILIS